MIPEKIRKGLKDIIEEEELSNIFSSSSQIRVKLGIDPTASVIHLGHLALLLKLREFQRYGCEIILIIGDFTAKIGDPSGRTVDRPLLHKDEIERNADNIEKIVKKFLSGDNLRILYNSSWLSDISADEIFLLFSKFTVQRLLSRDDFKSKISEGEPLFTHRFLYPFLQAYDSVITKADIELGGHDQIFNLLLARDMQKSFNLKPQVCITLPLIEGTCGKLKMSKSYNNYIAVDEKPEDVYGKTMGIPDELMNKYFLLLTDIPEKEIEKMNEKMLKFDMKRKLAYEITKIIFDEKSASNAQEWFDQTIRKKVIPENIEEITYNLENESEISVSKLLKRIGLLKSTSEALRIIQQGGVEINGKRINSDEKIKRGEYLTRVGKLKFAKIIVN